MTTVIYILRRSVGIGICVFLPNPASNIEMAVAHLYIASLGRHRNIRIPA